MTFLKKFAGLKIRHKLMIPVFLYLFLLAVVSYFYFSSNRLMNNVSDGQKTLSEISVSIRNTTVAIKDLVNRDIEFSAFEEENAKLLDLLEGQDSLKKFEEIGQLVKLIDELNNENDAIELKISEAADKAIDKSDTYITEVVSKLANQKTRTSVSTLEIQVIAGANVNTVTNYQLKVLFGRMKEDINLKSNVLGFINTMMENVEKDIKSLEGTSFQTLATESREAALQIQGMMSEYINNIETVQKTQSQVFNMIEEGVTAIDTENSKSSEDLFNRIRTSASNIIIVLLITAIIGTLLNILVSRSIVLSFNELTRVLKDMASGEGDLTIRLNADSRDEFGEAAGWFNTFIDKIHAIIRDVASKVVMLNKASAALSDISKTLTDGAENTSNKSNMVASAAEEMSSNINSVASSMEQASTNVSIVSSSVEEMTATINEISRNTENAKIITEQAVSEAGACSAHMGTLGHAAQEIGKVVETITEISEQVNLLALNATIEAARAGEVGKGFAVVANEIKDLAGQTAQATTEIKDRVAAIQNSTRDTIGGIKGISDVVDDINKIVITIATAVEEQSVTTREIADNMGQVTQGINIVNENTAQSSTVANEIAKEIASVNSASIEISTGSAQVNRNAKELSELAGELDQLVGKFKV
ncbi:MAG: methyl-accepting chemotaxis protein [Deltaproteobacteria bacterium]|nr:methyl-accepting chemotaxis protein [Deltaproteobacteria bacterium]